MPAIRDIPITTVPTVNQVANNANVKAGAPLATFSGADKGTPTVQTPSSVPSSSSTSVITSSGAKDDFAQKQAAFSIMQANNATQAATVAQQKAIAEQSKAVSDKEKQDQANIQAGIDQKKKEADLKASALGLGSTAPTTPQNVPVPNYGDKVTDTSGNTGTASFDPNTGKAITPPQTPPTTQDKLTSATEDYNSILGSIRNAQDEAYAKMNSDIQSINSGVFPLTDDQQSQINSLQTQLAQNEASQKIANASYAGSVAQAAFRSGGEYTPEQYAGQIANAVSYGTAKILALDTSAAIALSDLKSSFKKDDYAMINDNYDKLNKHLEDKANSFKEMFANTTSILKDQRDQEQKITDGVNKIAEEAAKNGADPATMAKINASKSEAEAVANSGDYLQTATGTLGDYLQYKREAESKGLVPHDYQSYKDEQDQKALNLKVKEAYAVKSAQNQADSNFTSSDKNQQKLEQQYRGVLSKEYASRTGTLGIENAKVAQANHMNSLFTQYYDPKTGNYNIPKAQYAELAMGLANLISPGGSAESDRQAILSYTAKGDLNGAISYITGTPQNGNTQDIIKNLKDSMDRQAETATRNREAALQNLRDQAPTDLSQDRIDKLNKSTEMVKYEGQDRISKANVDSYVKSNPQEAESIAKLYEVPGATDQDIEEYLKALGKTQ